MNKRHQRGGEGMRNHEIGLIRATKSLILLLASLISHEAAQASGDGLKLAISQGISSPTITSPVNFYKGYTPSNPSIAGTLKDASFTIEYATTKEATPNQSILGAEIAAGSGRAGIVAAYRKESCDACETRVAGMGGLNFDFIALGVGYYEESTYTAGFILNPKKKHRLGFTGSMIQGQGGAGNTTAYGLGYSYNSDSLTFALDASKRTSATPSAADDVMLVTPGLQVKADGVALSVSHNIYMNDTASPVADNTWFGVGMEMGPVYIAFYQNFVSEWALTSTFWF